MKQSGFVVFVFALVLIARGSDATSPIDYTQRNEPYAPGTSVTAPKKDAPKTNESVQQKRFEKSTIEKQNAPLAERRASISEEETRAKSVREKDSHRPETIEQPKSAFNHKPAAISTSGDTTRPPTVAKYQDSLATATPWGPGAATGGKAHFAATEAATTAKINRFVFRKNPADSSAMDAAVVTPAAGGAVIQKK